MKPCRNIICDLFKMAAVAMEMAKMLKKNKNTKRNVE
jgi:hypothetical protein